MQEIKITKTVVNERKELIVSFICKEGDYTEIEAELLRQAKNEGNFLDISFDGLVKGTEDQRKKELQKLGGLLAKYCENAGISESTEIQRLYNKYGIISRTQLTDDQLSVEIESYRAGLLQYN